MFQDGIFSQSSDGGPVPRVSSKGMLLRLHEIIRLRTIHKKDVLVYIKKIVLISDER